MNIKISHLKFSTNLNLDMKRPSLQRIDESYGIALTNAGQIVRIASTEKMKD